jgi:hypothetical protein
VEVSASFEGRDCHILAYDPDLDHQPLRDLLYDSRMASHHLNDHIIRQLIHAGYDIAHEDYTAYTYDRTRGGSKALNFLIDRGFCRGPRDYVQNLVSPLPERQSGFPQASIVIATIREASGIPILAHPGIRSPPEAPTRTVGS